MTSDHEQITALVGDDDAPACKPELPADYAEMKRKILAAIDDNFCTARGIKLFTGFQGDIYPYLEEMRAERDIIIFERGHLTGYFRPEKVPVRFCYGGRGGRVTADYSEEPQIRIPPPLAPTGSASWRETDRNANLFNKPGRPQGVRETKPRPSRKGKYLIAVDYRRLSESVAAGLSVSQLCLRFRITQSTYFSRLRNDAEFRAAVLAGRQKANTEKENLCTTD